MADSESHPAKAEPNRELLLQVSLGDLPEISDAGAAF